MRTKGYNNSWCVVANGRLISTHYLKEDAQASLEEVIKEDKETWGDDYDENDYKYEIIRFSTFLKR